MLRQTLAPSSGGVDEKVELLASMTVVLAVSFFTGCDVRTPSLSALLKSADSTTIETRYGRTGSPGTYVRRVRYGQAETDLIVRSVLAARRDRGTYDTLALNSVKFYAKSVFLVEIRTCSGLFRLRGKQYRDKSSTLSRLVDNALEAAPETKLPRTSDNSRQQAD